MTTKIKNIHFILDRMKTGVTDFFPFQLQLFLAAVAFPVPLSKSSLPVLQDLSD